MAIQNSAYHVLLIEEDPKETELYSDLIREVDHCRVDVMSRLENSFDWISRSNYHLVVIDASLRKSGNGALTGGTDGLAILEQIKRISPVTSVILISEQGTVEQAVAAIRLGAEDYLKKPFNLEGFKLAVKRGLDRKALFGGDVGVSNVFHLLNSCQMISATLEQGKIFGIVQSYFSRELRCDHTAIYQLVPGSEQPELVRADATPDGREGHTDRAMEEIIDISLQATRPIPGMLEQNEYTKFIERGQLTPGLFIFRFKCAGANQFFCVSLSPQRPSNLDEFESRLRMLRLQIEVTGKNIDQYMGVADLVYRDDATGLYNTRYLNYILDREIVQSKTSGKSFAVLFIDADRFKGINDTHGHLVGTKLLNELGEHFKRFVRERDTVFRYGGDEFVAVLSSCDLPTARVVAERIRASVEERAFLADEGLNLHFTVSIGVAIFPEHAKSKKEIIDAADHAMYDAKKSTRNSVAIAGMPKPKIVASKKAK
jgi:diguanylate cyclase (GGDEF)-like protein